MFSHKISIALGGSVLAISTMSVHAFAQGPVPAAAENDSGVGDIIVTAQKREQSVMDVGASLSVLGSDTLVKQRIIKAEDLAIAVPSLTFARSDYNTPIFSLRGVGFNSSALAAYPAVSFYVDEVPFVFSNLAANATFDLQRIEVLKGPQGTLFGQNSTGGAINLIANKPTDQFDAGISLTYGRFNLIETTGHISGPLSETLRGRIAFQAHHMDKWQKSFTRPGDKNGREEYYTARGILEWEPSDSFRAVATVNGFKDKTQPLALALAATTYAFESAFDPAAVGALAARATPLLTQPIIPTNPRFADWGGPLGDPSSDPTAYAQATPTRLYSDRDMIAGSLRMEFKPTDQLLLTSITSYADFNQESAVSRSGSAAQNEDQTAQIGSIKTFNQELRLENTGVKGFHWVVGANYERSKASEFQLQSYMNNTSAVINGGIFQNTIDNASKIDNWAVFGNVDYEILQDLNINLGTRYTKTKLAYMSCGADAGDGRIRDLFNFLGGLLGGGTPFTPIGTGRGQCFTLNDNLVPGEVFRDTLKENNVSWRAGLDYHVDRDILLYGSVSKGYKQGSYPTGSPAAFIGLQPVSQESVLAFEVGAKASLLDRLLSVNAAGFIYNYHNKQIRGTIDDPIFNNLPQLRNIPKSQIKGLELEVSATPMRGLRLNGSVVYLHSEITEIAPTEFDPAGVQRDMTGAPIPLTAKWSYKIDGEYTWDMGGVKPFFGATWRWEGKKDAGLDGSRSFPPLNPPGTPQNRFLPGFEAPFVIASYGILSGRAGFSTADDRWTFTAWCDNCTNKYYWLNVTVSQDNISRGVGKPATYGVTAAVKF